MVSPAATERNPQEVALKEERIGTVRIDGARHSLVWAYNRERSVSHLIDRPEQGGEKLDRLIGLLARRGLRRRRGPRPRLRGALRQATASGADPPASGRARRPGPAGAEVVVLLLATQAEPQMLAFEHPNLGRLVQPRHFPKVAETAGRGVPWAADNDAFLGFDAERFERMLQALAGLPGCLFVTCPDVVGDGGLTDILFEEWAPRIMRLGLPLAHVVQEEGSSPEWGGVPWGVIAALFIGCASDEEKLGERIRHLVAKAKRRGKWVHMGRVNSAKRIAYAKAIGCDSVDGTKWVRWRDTYLAEGLQLVSAPPQLALDATSEAIAR